MVKLATCAYSFDREAVLLKGNSDYLAHSHFMIF